tara:strand:- start:130 stop:825 length:696 start_codon:yes stop_codon:yes gene_type:complete
MNTIKILLIIGLVYFAFTQKSLKTRNMLLIVTGLLAFCMFSLEGFSVSKDDFDKVFGKPEEPVKPNRKVTISEDQVTVEGSNMDTFTFSANDDLNDDLNENNVTCEIQGITGGEISLKDGVKDTITGATDISSLFNCRKIERKKECGLADDKLECPIYNELQKKKRCKGDECNEEDFKYDGQCCKASCPKDKCGLGFFGGFLGNGGKKCDYSFLPWFIDHRCEKNDTDDDK